MRTSLSRVTTTGSTNGQWFTETYGDPTFPKFVQVVMIILMIITIIIIITR